jgi:uncharacterized RDD family membrane protein YckC
MKPSRLDVSGGYAGAVTRLLAHWVDIALAGFLFVSGSVALDYVLSRIAGLEANVSEPSLWRVIAGLAWLFIYWWVSLAMAGKTPGKALLGLRVLTRQGGVLSAWSAAVRTIALPLSYLLFGAGFLGIMIGKERRALHDVIAGSAVVYDWGPRTAELPTPISAFLDRRVATEGDAEEMQAAESEPEGTEDQDES